MPDRSGYTGSPYDVLHISPSADVEVIEAAYRALAKKYHPDSSSEEADPERMKELNWAHSILSDPLQRRAWDNSHFTGQQVGSRSNQSESPPPPRSAQPSESPPKAAPDRNGDDRQPSETTRSRAEDPTDGPSTLLSISYMFLLLVAFYTGALLIAMSSGLDAGSTYSVLGLYSLIARGLAAKVGAEGHFGKPVRFWTFLGVLLLSLVPLASWIVLYWAGKGIAKNRPSGTPALPLGLAAVPILIGGLILSGPGSATPTTAALAGAGSAQNSTSVVRPTLVPTSRVVNTRTPVPTAKVYGPAANGCIRWDRVGSVLVGREICVYGNVYSAIQSSAVFTISFSDDWYDFKVQDYNYYYFGIDPGDCIEAYGTVVDNGNFPILLVKLANGVIYTYDLPATCR